MLNDLVRNDLWVDRCRNKTRKFVERGNLKRQPKESSGFWFSVPERFNGDSCVYTIPRSGVVRHFLQTFLTLGCVVLGKLERRSSEVERIKRRVAMNKKRDVKVQNGLLLSCSVQVEGTFYSF